MNKLLRDYGTKTENLTEASHLNLEEKKKNWIIHLENYKNFWPEYCAKIKKHGDTTISKYHLAEKISNETPIFVNFHFRFEIEDERFENPLDDNFLMWLAYALQLIINDKFNLITDMNLELLAVVLTSKTHYYEDIPNSISKYICYDLRYQFPYSRINSNLYKKIIRPELIKFLNDNDIKSKLEIQPVDSWNDIINDKNEYLMMYGSSPLNIPKLEVYKIWGIINTEDNSDFSESENIQTLEIDGPEIDLCDIFDPNNHKHIMNGIITVEDFEENTSLQGINELEDLLPLFLSTNYQQKIILPKKNLNGKKITSDTKKRTVFGEDNNNKQYEYRSKLEMAEKLLTIISNNKFLNENTWLEIGKVLYTVSKGSKAGLNSWIKHTQKALVGISDAPSFLKEGADLVSTSEAFYQTFHNNVLDEKTLGWYAKKDFPDKYKEWHRGWCLRPMEEALSLTDYRIALSFYRMFWLEFVCVSASSHKWFRFLQPLWVEDDAGITLQNYMSEFFVEEYRKYRIILDTQSNESNDKNFKNNADATSKKIGALIARMENDAPKSRVLRQLRGLFYDPNFMENINHNDYITGVVNGVLEVVNGKLIFREGKPQDYLTKSTRVPYRPEYSFKHPLVKECMNWLSQVFVDKDLLHHFLKYAASGLIAGNVDKIFAIWTGGGANSKSFIIKLFECTFGTLAKKISATMFSEKPANSASASPHLALARWVRFLIADEPDDKDNMQKGVIKRFTGNDSFSTRLLHENGGDQKATFKLVLVCNNVPVVDNADEATRDRIRFFPFLSKYVDNAPKKIEEQFRKRRFPRDNSFADRIPILASAFLWILTEYFPYYMEEKLVDPQIVTDTTEKYWRENDIYSQFLAESVQKVTDKKGNPDKNHKIHTKEMYDAFKEWHREVFEGIRPPQRNVVCNQLDTRLKKRVLNCWHGVRLIDNDQDFEIVRKKHKKSSDDQESEKKNKDKKNFHDIPV